MSFLMIGFMIYSRMPMALALSLLIISLNPVQRIIGMSGWRVRSTLTDIPGHLRHGHVGDDKVKVSGLSLECLQGRLAVFNCRHLISQGFQHLLPQLNNGDLIIDEQNPLLSPGKGLVGCRFKDLVNRLDQRNIDVEGRPQFPRVHCKP